MRPYVALFFVLLFMGLCGACSNSNGNANGDGNGDGHDLNLYSGKVDRYVDFKSAHVADRTVDVWLPDDYGHLAGERYAVLYMHDGQMLFDATKTWNKQEWGVDETMGELLAGREVRSTIVVGVWNTEFRHSEYFPQRAFEGLDKGVQDSLLNKAKRYETAPLFKAGKVQSDAYLRFLVEELKPFIDEKYATLRDRENTFVAGSSMGGLISMYALCEYPEVFKGAACLSTHWVGSFDTLNNPIPAQFERYLEEHLPKPAQHKLYFDYGTETLDALYEPYQWRMDSVLIRRGYDELEWLTMKFPGEDHSERSWRKRLAIPLRFLLRK